MSKYINKYCLKTIIYIFKTSTTTILNDPLYICYKFIYKIQYTLIHNTETQMNYVNAIFKKNLNIEYYLDSAQMWFENILKLPYLSYKNIINTKGFWKKC